MLTQLLLKLTYFGAEWILWLLLVLSLISIALIVERWFYFARTRVNGDELAAQLHEQLRNQNLQGAWQLVKDEHTYVIECGVVAAGLVNLRNGPQATSEAMLSAKARMRTALDANLSILATIGSNAPFIGLLGTVLGIIKAAHELNAAAGQNNPSAVMGGVFEALVATAVGLFVAIPAVVAYNLFQRRVRTRMAQTDAIAHLVLANMAPARAARRSVVADGANQERVMAGGFSSSSYEDDEPLSEINVTPLVDVTLVLLIVFMITVPAIVGSAPVNVDLPESTAIAAASEQLPLVFSLKPGAAGRLEIFLNEQLVDEAGIRRMFAERGAPPDDQRVSLSADKAIPYGEVIKFVDLLEALGLKKLSLDTRHVESR